MSALLLRDMRLAMRAGGGFGLSLAFFLIVVVLVPFGVGPEMGHYRKLRQGFCGLGHCWPASCRLIGFSRWILRMARWTYWRQRPSA